MSAKPYLRIAEEFAALSATLARRAISLENKDGKAEREEVATVVRELSETCGRLEELFTTVAMEG